MKEKREKKPQIAVMPDKHKILKDKANADGMKLEALADECLTIGMKMKRLLPDEVN